MSDSSKSLLLSPPRRLGLSRRPVVIGIAVLVLLMLSYIGFTAWRMSYVPADLDLNTTRLSEAGLYKATILPAVEPIPINQLHTWTLYVETADGQPIQDAAITVEGDMPQHGHGMPTRPQVTRNLGNGDYLVEGVKFQMGGWWVVDFTVKANGGTDKIFFNLLLQQ